MINNMIDTKKVDLEVLRDKQFKYNQKVKNAYGELINL